MEGLGAIGLAGLYAAFTVPLLLLLIRVHAWGSPYTRLFQAALLLQIVPVGLVYLPLGAVSLGVLGYALWKAEKQVRQFRALGVSNPAVERRWGTLALAAWGAMGCACQQKVVAVLFVELVAHQPLAELLPAAVGVSGLGWLALLSYVGWQYRQLPAAPAAGGAGPG